MGNLHRNPKVRVLFLKIYSIMPNSPVDYLHVAETLNNKSVKNLGFGYTYVQVIKM